MKALILTSAEWNYDYAEHSIEGLYMVPDDFDPEADQQAYVKTLLDSKDARLRWTKSGKVHGAYYPKARALWIIDLGRRFERVPYVEHEA